MSGNIGKAVKRRVTRADLLSSPASFCAFGFGSGLAPVAPGTFGTLPGIVIAIIISPVPLWFQWLLIVAAFVAGIRFCDIATARLGTHDHGAIVWDEIVGILITLAAVPLSLGSLIFGFLLFRFFDVLKPWPIGWVDRKIDGGLGIMVDDVIAGVFAGVCLYLLTLVAPTWF